MTGIEQNILTRQIKGLTWGVVIAIVGTFGGGAVFIVHSYVDIQRSISIQTAHYEQVQKNEENASKRMDGFDNRLSGVEGKLIPQAMYAK